MSKDYLIFYLDEKTYAINLEKVVKVYQIVNITPIPKGPEYLLGLINVHGQITPVVNLRYLLELKKRPLNLTDQLIIVKTEQMELAFVVDRVSDIIPAHDENSMTVDQILPDARFFELIIKDQDDFILAINPDVLLTRSEINKINKQIKREYEKITEKMAEN